MKKLLGILVIGLMAGMMAAPGMCAGGSTTPQWIWYPEKDMDPITEAPAEARYFVKTFELDSAAKSAKIEISADNVYQIYVNGVSVGEGDNWQQATVYDIAKNLKKGKNTIAVMVSNADGPAGWIMTGKAVADKASVSLSTDSSWKSSTKETKGWKDGTVDASWVKAVEEGEYGSPPWGTNVQCEMLSQ